MQKINIGIEGPSNVSSHDISKKTTIKLNEFTLFTLYFDHFTRTVPSNQKAKRSNNIKNIRESGRPNNKLTLSSQQKRQLYFYMALHEE